LKNDRGVKLGALIEMAVANRVMFPGSVSGKFLLSLLLRLVNAGNNILRSFGYPPIIAPRVRLSTVRENKMGRT
jgi:hypothetical protein